MTVKHRESWGSGLTAEYRAWSRMKNRCYNPHAHNYAYYGGRGIKVCSGWFDNYEKFLQDMGRRPSKRHSLDRIDNNDHYYPANCRWATKRQQALNRRKRGTCHVAHD